MKPIFKGYLEKYLNLKEIMTKKFIARRRNKREVNGENQTV